MKYTVQSTRYLVKNFWYIVPFAIIPAFLLALSTDHEAVYCLMDTLFSGSLQEAHFSHVFRAISILNFASWQAVVFGLLGVVGCVVCVAMMMALLDKHMRIGKRTYNGIFSKLNDNVVSTFQVVVSIFAIYEVWSLITAALVFLFMKISNLVLAYILICLSYIVMHIVLIYLIGFVYLWLPCMQITGFHAMEALQYSQQLMVPVKWRILIKQILFLFAAEALTCVCAYFLRGGPVFMVVASVLYALLIMIFCVRMMVVYFDRDNIERADLKRYYQR